MWISLDCIISFLLRKQRFKNKAYRRAGTYAVPKGLSSGAKGAVRGAIAR